VYLTVAQIGHEVLTSGAPGLLQGRFWYNRINPICTVAWRPTMKPPLIAVVDDDTAFLEVMSDLLIEEGYQVRTYTNGSEAYQQLKNAPPTLIILDIRYAAPESGWETLELLRLDPTTAPIPIIVCSADVMLFRAQSDRLAAMCVILLEKPFLIDELLN
jgi:CheY-like chemotaxis protein